MRGEVPRDLLKGAKTGVKVAGERGDDVERSCAGDVGGGRG